MYSLIYLAWRAVANQVRISRGLPAIPVLATSPSGSAAMRSLPSPPLSRSALLCCGSGTQWMYGWACSRSSRPSVPILPVHSVRDRWCPRLPPRLAPDPVRVGYACFAAATALSLVYVTFRTEFTGFFEWSSANIGQFTWASYETVLCVGFALGLLVFFRDHVRGTSQLQRSAVQLVRSC